MDRFKVKEVQCSSCETLQQVILKVCMLWLTVNDSYNNYLNVGSHFSRHSRLARTVTCSLGSITVTFATCLTRIRNSITVNPVEYAGESQQGLHILHIST